MTTYLYDTYTTALGPFSAAIDAAGAVVGTAFGGEAELRSRLGPSELRRDAGAGRAVREQVQAYLAGERQAFTLPLAPQGSAFQHRVWEALRAIPFGETRSYGELARSLGSSARAVGRANATNPICLLIPCHRVIGADRSLTGFAFGEPLKRRLLDLEQGVACLLS